MPLGFLYQVLLGLDLKDFNFYCKIWSKSASGQIATNTGCFRSRKFLTGGFSSLEIFFWFPLLIALSGQLSNDHCRRRNASFF
ncbi:hypothetical protein RGQ29_007089 [Quercus rubra]|uniref:Uncharacterized protein n=1 Tax=Quercus rubra TaxID=3512 RepID=A0AAN7I6L2_QUERU|nr:hypothetical protein RGQ29_007089 [Quercus rubra]